MHAFSPRISGGKCQLNIFTEAVVSCHLSKVTEARKLLSLSTIHDGENGETRW